MKSTQTARYIGVFAAAMIGITTITQALGAAESLPGKGVIVQPGQENIDGENFQTIIVIKA